MRAVAALSGDDARGFVFVRPDGEERLITFKGIHAEAKKRARHLASMGAKRGDRVAIVIPDGDEFVLTFLGAMFAGLVPVPIYPQLSFKNVEGYHDTVTHIVDAAKARVLVTTEKTKEFVDPVLGRATSLGKIETVDALHADVDDPLEVDVAPDELAFLQFTSGSTSRPKGVSVTHANLAANSECFMIHGLAKDSSVDKGVSWLPLFHDMGLIGFVIGPLFTDIPVVFMPTASFVRTPRLWLDKIHQHRGTITYAPNFAYQLVTKRLKDRDVESLDLSCLRIAGCGAEPIQGSTLRDFAKKLEPAKFSPRAFLPSYGMAEATLAITFVHHAEEFVVDRVDPDAIGKGKADRAKPGEPNARELVGCGSPFPGHEVIIVDEAGKRLGEREVGEILTRGPSITTGYYDEPELTQAAFKDNWLHTGDLGYFADGQLYICGRLKDIIIVRGRNFYPHDIEWAVGELPQVRRGNVVAFSVEAEGEEQLIVCAEAMRSDVEVLTESIKSTVSAQIGLSVYDVVIVPQGTIPRTSSGKPQRRKTRQMYLDGTLPRTRAAQPAPAEGAVT